MNERSVTMKKLMKKFYIWTHVESRKFALLYLCLPIPAIFVPALMGPTVAFVVALAVWFGIVDKWWWKDVVHLFEEE